MRTLKRLDYVVEELSPKDADEIFGIIKEDMAISDNRTIKNKQLRNIQREIDFSFSEKNHHIIGIKKDNKIIGIAMCNNDDKIPWLGKFVIQEKFRKTKAMPILLYYIMEIVYPGEIIQFKSSGDESAYRHIIKKMPKAMDFDILDPEKINILKKIAGE